MNLPKTSYEDHTTGIHGYFIIGDWKLVLPKEIAKELHRRCEAHDGLVSRNILLESVLCNHIGWHCEEGHSPTLCSKCIANIKGLIRDKKVVEQPQEN